MSASFERWLTASENQRLAQLSVPARREEFIACRYALRWLLARDVRQIGQFPLEAPHGRGPRLDTRHPLSHLLHLSLSHSNGYIACAVSSQPVGIDIEILARQPRSTWHERAALACTDHERAELSTIADDEQRHRRFMQWWSLKEAWFKRAQTGVDLALLPRLACVQGDAIPLPRALAEHARCWTTRTPEGHAALLSVCSQIPDMRCELQDDAQLRWLCAGSFGYAMA
ncbi:4'-phosphopantetheinyl transferase family protein [Diaphorobacter aerolatus]|uniref:4'-phosphopantetheinyl transferase superfamily protein n=1 Tax=Diaphorobacter aerolatus TaxID=1288495 RepID=A0A7H0GM03_9BURK|nr:4'-phosphopantetheinyl transferase superfamily protein [Diaphorobacter aerolatus]QNP49319.1 4'-phosphopantetheinyl transferase superfamily protein [Diaphorobacter aerolatus]